MYPSGKLEAYSMSTAYMPAANNPGATMTNTLTDGDDDKYIVTTKILVLALAILFAVVFFVICLHIYAKWAWRTRAPESFSWSFWPRRWRRSRDSPIILDAEMLDINMVVGLNKAALEALPTFNYKADIEMGALECAICLGQFQEDELGRTLPKCNHRFHLECIDMWLYSHSTCPLCRDVLEPEEDDPVSQNMVESASVQVFRNERMRLRGVEPGDRHMLQERDAREESEDEDPHEQETGNKRADGIPANVLFWGNLMQQQGAELRVVNNTPQQVPSHIAIDRDRGSPRMRNQVVPAPHNNISQAAGSL